jgi:hypothetical protein
MRLAPACYLHTFAILYFATAGKVNRDVAYGAASSPAIQARIAP